MENFCSNCGNQLREGANFCNKCGTKVNSNNSSNDILLNKTTNKDFKSNTYSSSDSNNNEQDDFSKVLAYKRACNFMIGNLNNCKTALEIFEELGDFKDSSTKKNECKKIIYEEACKKISNQDIKKNEEAINIFKTIKDFLDSEDLINRCENEIERINSENKLKIYNSACDLMYSKKVDFSNLENESKSFFNTVFGFIDKSRKVYNDMKNYKQAIVEFNSIRTFKDSEAKIKECENYIEKLHLLKKQYIQKFENAFLVILLIGIIIYSSFIFIKPYYYRNTFDNILNNGKYNEISILSFDKNFLEYSSPEQHLKVFNYLLNNIRRDDFDSKFSLFNNPVFLKFGNAFQGASIISSIADNIEDKDNTTRYRLLEDRNFEKYGNDKLGTAIAASMSISILNCSIDDKLIFLSNSKVKSYLSKQDRETQIDSIINYPVTSLNNTQLNKFFFEVCSLDITWYFCSYSYKDEDEDKNKNIIISSHFDEFLFAPAPSFFYGKFFKKASYGNKKTLTTKIESPNKDFVSETILEETILKETENSRISKERIIKKSELRKENIDCSYCSETNISTNSTETNIKGKEEKICKQSELANVCEKIKDRFEELSENFVRWTVDKILSEETEKTKALKFLLIHYNSSKKYIASKAFEFLKANINDDNKALKSMEEYTKAFPLVFDKSFKDLIDKWKVAIEGIKKAENEYAYGGYSRIESLKRERSELSKEGVIILSGYMKELIKSTNEYGDLYYINADYYGPALLQTLETKFYTTGTFSIYAKEKDMTEQLKSAAYSLGIYFYFIEVRESDYIIYRNKYNELTNDILRLENAAKEYESLKAKATEALKSVKEKLLTSLSNSRF